MSVVFLVTLLLVGIGKANAEEFVISGNGENSANQINIATTSQTSIEQTNNANIENTVENTANTGGNEASGNTGGNVAITTGTITSDTSIENSGNVSAVRVDCCPTIGEATITIEGNGKDSENIIDAAKESSTTVSITQMANITNTINTNANTGGNSANSNAGGASVSIATGTIAIREKVENTFINLAHVSAFDPSAPGDITITIRNNGDSSENSIFPKWFYELFIEVDNKTSFANLINTTANTGDNSADGNSGDVAITTGDIVMGITLKNGPINASIVDVSCCPTQHGKGGPPPLDPGIPTSPQAPLPTGGSGGGGGGSSSSSGGGQGGPGEVLAAMLPITGINWFFATIANILMFLLGLYLRRRSGRAPSLVVLPA